MNLFTTSAEIIITCPKRLSPWLTAELNELGYENLESFITGVRFKATLNECIALNLRLRCASQVLYQLKQFKADHPDEIYNGVSEFPWEKILKEPGYFSVTSNVNHPSIDNSMFANLRVKDAIVDRMRKATGNRPASGSTLEGAVIHLFWKDENAILYIDSSGDSLARHGYRKIPGQAPMLEALAAATIYATRWDRNVPFVNPMCGSGTVAIEAALIATKRYPGLFRNNYSFMHLSGFDGTVYQKERDKLSQEIIQKPGPAIIASDHSAKAIENSRQNAIAAGVHDMINFKVCDFRESPVPAGGKGIFFINPEYGERLGELAQLEQTYKAIGDFMKNKCRGYTGYVFTGNLDLAKKIGLKPSRRLEFYTSRIDCRLLEYELYEGTRSPRAGEGQKKSH